MTSTGSLDWPNGVPYAATIEAYTQACNALPQCMSFTDTGYLLSSKNQIPDAGVNLYVKN